MPDTDDYILISALQHYAYCPRQCALIHIEQVWDENLYTLRGHRVHEKVNVPEYDLVEDIRVERAMPLWSHQFELTGVGDVVEFHCDGTIFPVEYKSGSKKVRLADSIQLCAQAMCLEEMLNHPVPAGAIFHHGSRRRREVRFDEVLRMLTQQTITNTRILLQTSRLPAPVADSRCPDCSLIDACMPYALQGLAQTSAHQYPFEVDNL